MLSKVAGAAAAAAYLFPASPSLSSASSSLCTVIAAVIGAVCYYWGKGPCSLPLSLSLSLSLSFSLSLFHSPCQCNVEILRSTMWCVWLLLAHMPVGLGETITTQQGWRTMKNLITDVYNVTHAYYKILITSE